LLGLGAAVTQHRGYGGDCNDDGEYLQHEVLSIGRGAILNTRQDPDRSARSTGST
jgi:hypothetical protein